MLLHWYFTIGIATLPLTIATLQIQGSKVQTIFLVTKIIGYS